MHVGDEGNVVAKVKAMAVDGCDKLQVNLCVHCLVKFFVCIKVSGVDVCFYPGTIYNARNVYYIYGYSY